VPQNRVLSNKIGELEEGANGEYWKKGKGSKVINGMRNRRPLVWGMGLFEI